MDPYQKKHVSRIRKAIEERIPKSEKEANQFYGIQHILDPNRVHKHSRKQRSFIENKEKLLLILTDLNNQIKENSVCNATMKHDSSKVVEGVDNLQQNKSITSQKSSIRMSRNESHQMKHVSRIRSELEKRRSLSVDRYAGRKSRASSRRQSKANRLYNRKDTKNQGDSHYIDTGKVYDIPINTVCGANVCFNRKVSVEELDNAKIKDEIKKA